MTKTKQYYTGLSKRELREWNERMEYEGRRKPRPKRRRNKRKKKAVSSQSLVKVIEKVTDIKGDGYGSNHYWLQGITSLKPRNEPHKYTEYVCWKCYQQFKHYFEVQSDIFEFMKSIGIKEECVSDRTN